MSRRLLQDIIYIANKYLKIEITIENKSKAQEKEEEKKVCCCLLVDRSLLLFLCFGDERMSCEASCITNMKKRQGRRGRDYKLIFGHPKEQPNPIIIAKSNEIVILYLIES